MYRTSFDDFSKSDFQTRTEPKIIVPYGSKTRIKAKFFLTEGKVNKNKKILRFKALVESNRSSWSLKEIFLWEISKIIEKEKIFSSSFLWSLSPTPFFSFLEEQFLLQLIRLSFYDEYTLETSSNEFYWELFIF